MGTYPGYKYRRPKIKERRGSKEGSKEVVETKTSRRTIKKASRARESKTAKDTRPKRSKKTKTP